MQKERVIPLSSHAILRFASLFFSGTLISRLFGLGRDICLAQFFGTSPGIAAFFVAYRFSHLARRLFGEGSLQAAFIPLYEELKHKDRLLASSFFYRTQKELAFFLLGFISLFMGIIYYAAPLLPAAFRPIAIYSFFLFPSLLFICLFGLSASVLHSERRFFLSSVSSVSFNLVWIVSLPILAYFPEEQALPLLCIVISFASFAQYLTSYLPLRSTILPPKTQSSPRTQRAALLKTIAYGIIGVGATQINNFLDPFFAKFASAEGPAYLWYSVRIEQLPIGLIAVSFSSALLPALSSFVKQQKTIEAKQLLTNTLTNALFLTIFLWAGMVVLGSQGIQLLYGHGLFGTTSAEQTTKCLLAYSLGLVPTTAIILIAPYFYAYGKHKITSSISLIAVAANIVFNTIFIFILGWGTVAVALATSISAWINLALMLFFLKKDWDYLPFSGTTASLKQSFAIAIASSLLTITTRLLLTNIPIEAQLFSYPQSSFFSEALQFLFSASAFILPLCCFLLTSKKNPFQ